MKIVAVIPARYQSTRFPGKPLADICGKPMIYWVYDNISKSKKFDRVCVATDDERICAVCEEYKIDYGILKDKSTYGIIKKAAEQHPDSWGIKALLKL
jgi:3-deoxy-manno-octulosonate cytidylyltransferase (CMP-KDO synthetase)